MTPGLVRALKGMSYEVLPGRDTEQRVLDHVPREVALTVAAPCSRGLDATVGLAARLARHGYSVSPHLPARLVRDGAHLADVVAGLTAAGVSGLLVIGGDRAEPVGAFPDAGALLRALAHGGHEFTRVGIAGYPDGHGRIADADLARALADKAPYATHVVTQMCFSPARTAAWAREQARRGVTLPIEVGVPGVVARRRLVRIAGGLGLGPSARFLTAQAGLVGRFLLPRGYRPDRLVRAIAPELEEAGTAIVGVHVFTFDELARTEAWRRAWIDRLGAAEPGDDPGPGGQPGAGSGLSSVGPVAPSARDGPK